MAIPNRTDVPADGGAVVRTTPLELLSPSVLTATGAINLARQAGGVIRSGLQEFEYPKITGELDAAVVAEGAAYGLQGVDFDAESITLQKLGFVMSFTDEFLRSNKSVNGVDAEIAARVDRAFAKAWDVNLLGLENGSTSASAFAFDFDSGVTDEVELTEASGPALKDAVSQAVGEIYEGTGRAANGILIPSDVPQLIRDAKVGSVDVAGVETTNVSAYNSADPLWGLNNAVSHNLARVGDETAGSTVAIVGDFSALRVLIHADIESEVSRVASVDGDSGFETDRIYVKYRSYGTCYATQEDAFRKIVIPAGS